MHTWVPYNPEDHRMSARRLLSVWSVVALCALAVAVLLPISGTETSNHGTMTGGAQNHAAPSHVSRVSEIGGDPVPAGWDVRAPSADAWSQRRSRYRSKTRKRGLAMPATPATLMTCISTLSEAINPLTANPDTKAIRFPPTSRKPPSFSPSSSSSLR